MKFRVIRTDDFRIIELGNKKACHLVFFRQRTGLKSVLIYRGKAYSLPSFKFLNKWVWAVRGLFPTFWAIGLRDCDSGGRVYGWAKAMTWNHWHLAKAEKEWDMSSDGPPVVQRLTMWEYIRAPRWERV